jgi:hypothetical protein
MSTAEQYRAKAAEYRVLLGNPLSPSETVALELDGASFRKSMAGLPP